MRREEARDAAPGPLAEPTEGAEEARTLGPVVAREPGVAHAGQVSFALGVPTVAQEEQLCARPPVVQDPLSHAPSPDGPAEHGRAEQPELSELRPRRLHRGVPPEDVPDLVPEHDGQLRLVLEVGHQPTGDVDVTARQRERVGDGRVEHPERERRVADLCGRVRVRVGARGEHVAGDAVHVGRHTRVVVQTELGHDLGVGLAPDLDFLLPGVRGSLRLTGNEVGRGGCASRECGRNDEEACVSQAGGNGKGHEKEGMEERAAGVTAPCSTWNIA